MRSILIFGLFLSGCGTIETIEVPVPMPFVDPVPVHPSAPTPVNLVAPKFYVITEETYPAIAKKEPVLMAVSTVGYQYLTQDVQELRRYILELQSIVVFYKKSLTAFKEAAETTDE